MTCPYIALLTDRQLLAEENLGGKLIQIIKADFEKDFEVITEFLVDVFIPNNPLTEFLVPSDQEDIEKLKFGLSEELKHDLAQGLSLMALDGDNVVGVLVGGKHSLKGISTFDGFKKDYAEDCEKFPSIPRPWQAVRALIAQLNRSIPTYIPADANHYFCIEKIAVYNDYKGTGVGKKLWSEALKLAKSEGFKYATAECSAKASTGIAEKLGMPIKFAFPYNKMIADGEQCLPEKLCDGSTSLNLVIGDLDKIV